MAKKDRGTVEKQQTASGIYVRAGDIEHSDYDQKSWPDLQRDYYRMRNSDPLISTTVDVCKYPILMAEHRIESKNEDVVEYLNFVLDNLGGGGFQNLKYHKLLALDFGLSMHEMVVKRGTYWKGKLTSYPVLFNPIQNETIHEFKYDPDTVTFSGIIHERRVPEKGTELIPIEKENLEWFTFNEEYNDIRGRSLFRQVRMFWQAKQDVMKAKTVATQRGAGIVGIGTKGKLSSGDQSKAEQVGRSLTILKDGYFLYDEEKMKIDLLEPKTQTDVMPFLSYIDSQMFFNSMSQFMIAGIGQNGSRAATGEHKSSYEMFASYVLQILETNIQKLIDRIVAMSWCANIPDDEWPMFHFNSIKATDLYKVAQQIGLLISSGALTMGPEDDKMIREMFGFPEAPKAVEKPLLTKLEKKPERKLSREALEFEAAVFSLESANQHFETMQEKAKRTMKEILRTFLQDAALQLSDNRHADIAVKRKLIEAGAERMIKLYNEGFERGVYDIRQEVKKLSGGASLSLAEDAPITPKKAVLIEKGIKRLFYNAKNSIEVKMANTSDAFINSKGGLEEYVTGFELGFKGDQENVTGLVNQSYTDGRGETLMDLGENVELFFYTAKMDRSLCDNCAPFDGLIMTREEVEEQGLSFNAPVNPNCLGVGVDHERCRCQLVPYKLKES